MPTHISGHTLDLVLAPIESDFVGGIEISPIGSDISDHALLTFTLCFSRPPTYRKTITFHNYSGLDANLAANIIETDLVDAVARGQTSVQRTNSYNEVLSSARDQFYPVVTKGIIIKDDAPWYDHRMVSLHKQRTNKILEFLSNTIPICFGHICTYQGKNWEALTQTKAWW